MVLVARSYSFSLEEIKSLNFDDLSFWANSAGYQAKK